MELWIAFLFLLLTVFLSFTYKEAFDPFSQDTKPIGYPDQTMYGDLIAAQKYLQQEIKSPTLSEDKKRMLLDLLNLLQFI